MNKKRKPLNHDADLDEELSEYEPSDSDDEYDDNEKLMLERARKGKPLVDGEGDSDDTDNDSEEEEVLGVYSSEEEEDEGSQKHDGMRRHMMDDSDIEGMEDDDKLPDPKAWGKEKKDYYYTDYVDKDFGGFVKEQDEEAAIMEEKEARTLQSKLAAQLDDLDLSLGLLSSTTSKAEDDKVNKETKEDDDDDDDDDDVIKTDLSALTKREKLEIFQKESPEFFGLISDYKERLTFAKEKLFPIIKLIRSSRIPCDLRCAKFVELKTHLILNYCVNLAFYLHLKKKKIQVKHHPVISRLLKYRTLLQKMDALETPKFNLQLSDVILQLKEGKDIDFSSDVCIVKQESSSKKKKKKLKLLSQSPAGENVMDGVVDKNMRKRKGNKEIQLESESYDDNDLDDLKNENESNDSDDENPSKKFKSTDEFQVEEGAKRPITYEIAKNKGLTPHRKKEQRNPRVKHRNKYRNVLIRRRGQVRQVQNETTKYGGEIFGIKASVIKSRKFNK